MLEEGVGDHCHEGVAVKPCQDRPSKQSSPSSSLSCHNGGLMRQRRFCRDALGLPDLSSIPHRPSRGSPSWLRVPRSSSIRGSGCPEQKSLNNQERYDRNGHTNKAADIVADSGRHVEQHDHAERHPRCTEAPHRGASMVADPKSETRQHPNNGCRQHRPDCGAVRGIGGKAEECRPKHEGLFHRIL
jgi:hypothetical protein